MKASNMEASWVSIRSTRLEDKARTAWTRIPDKKAETWEGIRKKIAAKYVLEKSGTNFSKAGYAQVCIADITKIDEFVGRQWYSEQCKEFVTFTRANIIPVHHPLDMIIEDVGMMSKRKLDRAAAKFGPCKSSFTEEGHYVVRFDDYKHAQRYMTQRSLQESYTNEPIARPMSSSTETQPPTHQGE